MTENASETALPSTISSHISAEVRKRIIAGELKPGQALREEELQKRFGSSRGPIRESLRLLLQTGLVEHQPRRGFKVRDYTQDDIGHIYRLRAKLEGMVVEELENCDRAPLIENLKNSCENMRKHAKEKDALSYFFENTRFHQIMIDATKNRTLEKVLDYVNELSLPIRFRLLDDPAPIDRSLSYHEAIVSMIEAGDFEAAKMLTERHITENLARATAVFTGGEAQ